MVTVRRLLGLNAEAGSEDIRAFFHGLYIPEGGVHIIGGRRGEAFIIFTTERDGQLAMERSGELLRGSSITLHVSSLAELKRKIESRLRKHKRATVDKRKAEMVKRKAEEERRRKKKKVELEKKAAEPQAAPSTDLGTALLLGLVAAIQGMQSSNQENQGQSLLALPQPYHSENPKIQSMDQTYSSNTVQESDAHYMSTHDKEYESDRREVKPTEPGYLRLYGLSNHISKKKVCRFLEGLHVLEVIPNVFLGRDLCYIVKVGSLEEAEEGLKYSHRNLEESCVEVRTAHERMWTHAVELYENGQSSTAMVLDRISPDRRLSQTPPGKRLSEDRSLSGSPKRRRFDSVALGAEYCVMVKNLSPKMTKTAIKDLLCCQHIPNKNVLHLLNKCGARTSTAFVVFTDPEHYASVMNMDGTPNGSKTLTVSSITREKMWHLMHKERMKDSDRSTRDVDQYWTALSCIYARNFPADVRKREIKDFFCMYHISENDITLLEDDHGHGIGEAVIQFESERAAKQACSLHGEIFLGQKIILTCISPQQMSTILHETQ